MSTTGRTQKAWATTTTTRRARSFRACRFCRSSACEANYEKVWFIGLRFELGRARRLRRGFRPRLTCHVLPGARGSGGHAIRGAGRDRESHFLELRSRRADRELGLGDLREPAGLDGG